MGREVVVAITEGKLHLGPWEHIFYYDWAFAIQGIKISWLVFSASNR